MLHRIQKIIIVSFIFSVILNLYLLIEFGNGYSKDTFYSFDQGVVDDAVSRYERYLREKRNFQGETENILSSHRIVVASGGVYRCVNFYPSKKNLTLSPEYCYNDDGLIIFNWEGVK
jgi:hypothetical protein